MAEKFDKYYTHFSRETRIRRTGLREINLGILKINLEGGIKLGLWSRPKTTERASGEGVVEREEVRLVNPPSNIRAVKGRYVEVMNGELESVEGEEVRLTNVNVDRVIGKHVTIINSDVKHVEGEQVELVNTDAEEVVTTEGSFINCNIEILRYRKIYTAVDTNIDELQRIN